MNGDAPQPTILRFRVPANSQTHPIDRYLPFGEQLVNSLPWRGKERRTCAVTSVRTDDTSGPGWIVEVTYRPKGSIWYVGETRYDGWTAMMLNRSKDGTLLDRDGSPLPPGSSPVYLPFEVYKDRDFNEVDFGEFVDELPLRRVERMSYRELLLRSKTMGANMGIHGGVVAPRRSRPDVRILLTRGDYVSASRDSYMRTIMVNVFTPHLKQTILDRLYEMLQGYLEGRFSLPTLSVGDTHHVSLGGLILELANTERDEERDRKTFDTYVSIADVEDLAVKLAAVYAVEVRIDDGEHIGLVFRRSESRQTIYR